MPNDDLTFMRGIFERWCGTGRMLALALALAFAANGLPVCAKENLAKAKPAQSSPQGNSVKSAPPVKGEVLRFRTDAIPGAAATASKEPCFDVDEIVINGLELVDPLQVRQALAAKVVRCIGNGAAKEIVGAVNEAHSSRGFVTTQGYVPQQDLKATRIFVVNVVTGRVGRIIYSETDQDEDLLTAWSQLGKAAGPWDLIKKLSGVVDTFDNWLDRFQLISPDWTDGLKAWLALPLDAGDPVQLDRIQQGVDQLNKAASQKAAAKLEPGTEPGTSNIVITNPRSDAFRLSAGYEINGANLNNSGSSTAKRLRVDAAKDNLIGINDSWAASYAGGIDSNEVRTNFALPVRWLTLSLDGGYSENLSALSKAAELYSQTYTGAANVGTLLSRDKDQQTSVQAGLNWRHLERYINSAHLTPQTIAYARLGFSHQRFYDDRQIAVSAGLSRGLKILDATRDPALRDDSTPRAQFFKIDGSANYAQVIKGWGVFKLDISGQWTDLPLYSDDQLTLGSISSVRGFTRAPFKADRGAIARSEFSSAAPVDLMLGTYQEDLTFLKEALTGTQGFVFGDFGNGRDLANNRDVTRAAVGGGLRYKQGRLSADLTIAKPVLQLGLKKDRDTSKPEFYLTVTTKIF